MTARTVVGFTLEPEPLSATRTLKRATNPIVPLQRTVHDRQNTRLDSLKDQAFVQIRKLLRVFDLEIGIK